MRSSYALAWQATIRATSRSQEIHFTVNTGALIFAWTCMAATATALGLSLTVARRRRWGRPGFRWYASSNLIAGSAQLVNLYSRAGWAPYLFLLVAPPIVAGVLAEIRSSRRVDRASPATDPALGRPPDAASAPLTYWAVPAS
jgi:hypothetical protein